MNTIDSTLHATMLFRLLHGTQDDHYEAEIAPHLLRGLIGLDEESGQVGIVLWAMEAERVAWETRN